MYYNTKQPPKNRTLPFRLPNYAPAARNAEWLRSSLFITRQPSSQFPADATVHPASTIGSTDASLISGRRSRKGHRFEFVAVDETKAAPRARARYSAFRRKRQELFLILAGYHITAAADLVSNFETNCTHALCIRDSNSCRRCSYLHEYPPARAGEHLWTKDKTNHPSPIDMPSSSLSAHEQTTEKQSSRYIKSLKIN